MKASVGSTRPKWCRRPRCCGASAPSSASPSSGSSTSLGVLMRVVDRVMVLDHGEKISEGLPAEVAADPRVIEVYLGTEADAVQAAARR